MIKISPENLSQVSARESEKKHLQYKLYSSAMIKRKIYKQYNDHRKNWGESGSEKEDGSQSRRKPSGGRDAKKALVIDVIMIVS